MFRHGRLVTAINVFVGQESKTWMPGTRPVFPFLNVM
jgi:hypothetical protein